MANSAEEQLLCGQTWAEFCEVLKRSGQQILRPEAPSDALTRAEGFRYLSRLLRIALEMHVEFADPAFPGFFSPSHETAKIGADNPDNLYRYARLDGSAEYRIRGRRGTVAYLSLGTQKGGYETDGRMVQTGFLDSNKLAVEADGSFDIVLSARQHEGNWVRMEPGTNALVVRQTFLDRKAETPAELHIERLNGSDKPPVLDAERLHGGLLRAAGFVEGTARIFADWAQGYGGHVNALPPADQAVCQAAGGDPNIFYYHSCWALADDEALVVEVDRVPACDFWNFQINNYWMESLDYRYHDICLNKHGARLDANGGVTVILSARDPGLPNWLESAGHRNGTMCWRWVGAAQPVHPRTRVVKLDSLRHEFRENG
ncbi:DUF1214 domain-containing protein [Cupriavidus necator]|uniref:DUF1214 domain-containing protein n=1 Tax=Cupriavidus necator TaxID=106590 RepID=A0A367PGN9_CUPNE|nr:DUF1214 domain-containing protein [Cupriavidus necator]QQX87908.1 DUF1214 domain-containing protein [Cupriavidus necator]RCJ06156.1 DUF1214 domain-containing protein [Cupriavidus necator]